MFVDSARLRLRSIFVDVGAVAGAGEGVAAPGVAMVRLFEILVEDDTKLDLKAPS